MRDIFTLLLDLILPPPPALRKLRGETTDTFSRFYYPRTVRGVSTLSSYQNPYIQAAITANKFHHHVQSATLLAALLSRYLTSLPDSDSERILVPIPLSSQRQAKRGYNQVTEILKHLPPIDSKTYRALHVITRTRNTTPQTALGRTERLKNLHDAFSVDEQLLKKIPHGAHILIIDDVTTTGTTLKTAGDTLEKRLKAVDISATIEYVAIAH